MSVSALATGLMAIGFPGMPEMLIVLFLALLLLCSEVLLSFTSFENAMLLVFSTIFQHGEIQHPPEPEDLQLKAFQLVTAQV